MDPDDPGAPGPDPYARHPAKAGWNPRLSPVRLEQAEYPPAHCANHAAGDLFTRATTGLGLEMVLFRRNEDAFSGDVEFLPSAFALGREDVYFQRETGVQVQPFAIRDPTDPAASLNQALKPTNSKRSRTPADPLEQ